MSVNVKVTGGLNDMIWGQKCSFKTLLTQYIYNILSGFIDIEEKTAVCASVVSPLFPKYSSASQSVFWELCECVVL